MMTCLHCGHEWNNRIEKPKRCPHCQAINYSTPKKFTIKHEHPINIDQPKPVEIRGEEKW